MRRSRLALLFAAIVILGGGATAAEASVPDESLGGGSDIRGGSLVELTGGASILASHYVFADNPGPEPITVEFRAEATEGIEITPELDRFTIEPGTSTKDFFSIKLDPALVPGDYLVTVQLVRSDIAPRPGEVTTIPAVGTTFTIRIVGESAVVIVEARSLQSGDPVAGTLVLSALTGAELAFEVTREESSELTARVSPGRYRATYVLDGRELAVEETEVADGETATVRLDVNSVSFVIVGVKPVKDGDKVVVAELVASLDNHLRPIDGDITIQALVYLGDEQIDIAVVEQATELPIGVTEAKLTYRPATGFTAGDYRFQFELVTDDFTLSSPTQPTFTIKEPSSTDTTLVIGLAAGGAGVAAAAGGSWLLIRRRRLRRA